MKIFALIACALVSCKSQSLLEGKTFYDVILLEEAYATSHSYNFDKSDYHVSIIDNSEGQWATAVTESGIYKIRGTRVLLTPQFKLVCSNLIFLSHDASNKFKYLEPCSIDGSPEYVGVSRDTLSNAKIEDFGFTSYLLLLYRSNNAIELRRNDKRPSIFPFKQWPMSN